MFKNSYNRLRNALSSAISVPEIEAINEETYDYRRPNFLGLNSEEEIKASSERHRRPIIVPRDSEVLPWNTGYAECVNFRKSTHNEDQAVFVRQNLEMPEPVTDEATNMLVKSEINIPYFYFGIFDGHAGVGAALAASTNLQIVLHKKLLEILEDIWPCSDTADPDISKDLLITGALETAFLETDLIIQKESEKYETAGGCTVLVALMILGRVFVSNAGDSRGICCLFSSNQVIPMSYDFTPDTERTRIRQLAAQRPELLGTEFTCNEYFKKPSRDLLGQQILYKDPFMEGWAYKEATIEDIKMPIITGSGKRSRVMGTIGVTRGFGDFNLKANYTNIKIKPFLSALPKVKILELSEFDIKSDDIIILATDGLWDVTPNNQAYDVVFNNLSQFKGEKHRFTSAAQALVAHARGKLKEFWAWRMSDSKPGTIDDISVFVIPLAPYKKEYIEWAATICKDNQKSTP